jgi:DNA-binding response OmpR family regulator
MDFSPGKNIMAKPLVLIIEDDPTQNQIFTITLESDFEVETFTDGDAASTRLDEVVPALLVLDLNLPGVPGKEILAKICEDERLSETRVILATANERQADMLFEQADMVLLKPISPGQLKQLAQRLCIEC